MSKELLDKIERIREYFRVQHNTDFEITCVFAFETGIRKVGYRYLVSVWDLYNVLEKNIYSNDKCFDTYQSAFEEALKKAQEYHNVSNEQLEKFVSSEIPYQYVD